MPAHEAAVFGEGDVAFEDAGAHWSAGPGGLDGLFGELKRATAAMANAEVRDGEGPIGTRLQLLLESGFGHVVDYVVRTRAQRYCIAGRRCRTLKVGVTIMILVGKSSDKGYKKSRQDALGEGGGSPHCSKLAGRRCLFSSFPLRREKLQWTYIGGKQAGAGSLYMTSSHPAP